MTTRGVRPEQPEPFLRGCAYPGTEGVPYPRADPADAARLPGDTWAMAQLPVGVRLELVGDAEAVELSYTTVTDDLGYRGEGAGRYFSLWRGGLLVDEAPAVLGSGQVRLSMGDCLGPAEPAVIYLPEGMRPVVEVVKALGGRIDPAPGQPIWVAYGDSVAEGWIASGPALAWPAIAGRQQGLDVRNLGYAGAARGEVVSAEHVSALQADVISISHGTNCWTRVPHSTGTMREALEAFLTVVRQGHPDIPVLVASPVIRPDAENTPNRLGATLSELRAIMEEVVGERMALGDTQLDLIPGAGLIGSEDLADGIHPGDVGHQKLASALGPSLSRRAKAA